jgi:type IV pilus assembly protein PilM
MPKFQPVWAIDIGQAALKALKLVPGEEPDSVHAEAFDFVEYPKILSQPDADAEELVREALATFLGRNDLKGCRIALGVPGQAGLVKFVKLPPVERSRIPDIVKFEARQHIPFALEEVIWDYQQIGAGEDEEEFAMVEIGLFAMKRDQIARAMLPLRAAGIEVDIVQMGPIALYNSIAYDSPPPQPENLREGANSYVVLDIGADNTDLIITDGARIWQRNVPIGGNHFTRALSKELKLTFAKAEHLKRNATKAPDPRAIFTAMRGVFNDFASEVSRSIGFYQSVNRQAKIVKIIGLGNGFKLPGLQKFLQQNVNHEVVRLERFERLEGDEVVGAPAFQENIASFAVPYGLALQGLDMGRLHTNLLPPEIEQTRMIRRKKPWALAASTLLLLGFSAMFVSAWAALEKVRPLETPANSAKSVADQGAQYESAFKSAKDAFNKVKEQGETIVGDTPESASWPGLIQTVLGALPNPARELREELREKAPDFDPGAPANIPIVGMLRVHVDKIVPVWRDDLRAEWFDLIEKRWLDSMHALDREKPPEGSGWVIQIVGHHYNPSPLMKGLDERYKPFARGPLFYIQNVILPRLQMNPVLRLAGLHHAALTWFNPDSQWTTEKGITAVPPPPMLARAEPKGEGGAGGGADLATMMKSRMGGMGGMPGMGMPGGVGGSSGDMSTMMMSRMGGPGMPGMMGAPARAANAKDQMTYLTRTDFKIELVWQPPKPESLPKTDEERTAKIEELAKSLREAASKKGAPSLDEASLAKASRDESEQALTKAMVQEQVRLEAAQKAEGEAPAAAPAPGADTNAAEGR